jgi:hypothetical protein
VKKQRVTRGDGVKDKYVPRWERPRPCGPVASAHAALVAPTSASAQTNYGQNRYRVRSKVGTDSGQNEYLTSSMSEPKQDLNQHRS